MASMDTRRDFFKKAAQLTGSAGLASALLLCIKRAAAIEPPEKSTFLDAEHVVILMQENRSFDHCFGTLRGVRGFNDPRAVTLPDGNPVWLQSNASGETYAPFRLDAQRTNATWLGSLPHSWTDQNDAKNGGDHDKWLIAKPTSRKDCAGMPLTMGYYNREDLPFYYALADAFTICDQHFCSSLTGTTPNRLYLWSGTIREKQNAHSPAKVRNEDVDYGVPAHWTTFPERLEDAGVTWKIYQNELSVPSGLDDEHDDWLANFTDNPIEWFPQFAVQFAKHHREYVDHVVASFPAEIKGLEEKISNFPQEPDKVELEKHLSAKRRILEDAIKERRDLANKSFDSLPERTRRLHERAFTTNAGDPEYRDLTTLQYEDGAVTREVQIPKGDILYQFRKDVSEGNLPAVSWIVAPEKFSDHPSAPWYGAWYVAEAINILTENPDVWKKTIFILTYDENDGFFDHMPPFGAPQPGKPETGAVTQGIDISVEYVSLEQDLQRKPVAEARGGSIGLGFRVPLLIASPWSRGGVVCSQVFDHTSVLQFLEKFASHKTGKPVRENNITEWRRTVCGDLTSVFQAAEEKPPALPYPEKDAFIERIHKAKFKMLPGYRALTAEQITATRRDLKPVTWMARQEPGIRPARPLPYELHAEGGLSEDRGRLELTLAARSGRFGKSSAGAPFYVYAPSGYRHNGEANRTRYYAVAAGQLLQDHWLLAGFPNGRYHLCVCGPNGFLLELAGDSEDPRIQIQLEPARHLGSELKITLVNTHRQHPYSIAISHHAYGMQEQKRTLLPGQTASIRLDLTRSFLWYDFSVHVERFESFNRRYAGHFENGQTSFSDPAMGGIAV